MSVETDPVVLMTESWFLGIEIVPVQTQNTAVVVVRVQVAKWLWVKLESRPRV